MALAALLRVGCLDTSGNMHWPDDLAFNQRLAGILAERTSLIQQWRTELGNAKSPASIHLECELYSMLDTSDILRFKQPQGSDLELGALHYAGCDPLGKFIVLACSAQEDWWTSKLDEIFAVPTGTTPELFFDKYRGACLLVIPLTESGERTAHVALIMHEGELTPPGWDLGRILPDSFIEQAIQAASPSL